MNAPPTAEELMATMQGMLIEDPEQNAMIFLGADDQDIVMPCTEHPTDMLAVLEQAIRNGILPSPHWIAILSDSYSIVVPEGEEMPAMRPGLLGELFEAGDPRVKEAILAVCIAPDGPSYSKQQSYTKAAGTFVWDEIRDMPTKDMGGAIANGMRRILGMEPVKVQ